MVFEKHHRQRRLIVEYFHASKEKPNSYSSRLPKTLSLIYHLSLWICLFWAFYTNGIIYWVGENIRLGFPVRCYGKTWNKCFSRLNTRCYFESAFH